MKSCIYQHKWYLGVLYIFLLLYTRTVNSDDQTGTGPCYSLNSLLALFNSPQYKNLPEVNALMEAYNNNCQMLIRKKPGPKTMLLIAIESSLRRRRFTIASKLARALKSVVLITTPEGFERMRFSLQYSKELKRAYHSLCLYALANNARQLLNKSHVIISGYWLDQAAFVIAKNYFPNYPPNSSPVWTWPKDLLAPDIIFYIDESDSVNLESHNGSMHYRMKEVYKRWTYPKVVPILNSENYNDILREMIAYINMHLHLHEPSN